MWFYCIWHIVKKFFINHVVYTYCTIQPPAINSQLCIFKNLYSKIAQKILIILYILSIAKNNRLWYYNNVLEGKHKEQKLNKKVLTKITVYVIMLVETKERRKENENLF